MRLPTAGNAGMTLIEVLLGMVVGLIALSGVYTVLTNQSREYALHRETIDVGETLRGAALLLTSELQHTSARRTDLYSIAPSTISLRSFQTAGSFCAAASGSGPFGVWLASGLFATGADDSALVLRLTDQSWARAKVTQTWSNPGGGAPGGTSPCTWTGGGVPPRVVQITPEAGNWAGIGVGSAMRGFRRTTYSLVPSGGKWWLGRKLGDPNAGSWELVTGPLRASPDGLLIQYYDAGGVVTTNPFNVARVTVTLKAESFGDVRGNGGARATRKDSVSVTAYLRN
jgi:prepilin-type N-terminal cleavage/methylation domain-containing protein